MRRSISELIGVRVLTAMQFPDERGAVLRSYTLSGLAAAGISAEFSQAIQSRSKRGVVRGLHFQWNPLQGKLVRCVTGAILDILVDVRLGSPTLGDHVAIELSGATNEILWAPPGFAHGFMALADDTIVMYECTAEWAPESEGGILWSDPALGIEWPAIRAIVSPKDNKMPTLAQWLADPRSAHFRLATV